MKKIEIKKDSFLRNAKSYALKKKEKPVKLPMPPDAIATFKVKFPFAKVEEVTLTPERLSFFGERFGMKVKAKVTDSDPSKTYYAAYMEALLNELAKSGIYVGMNVEEKLHALSAWVEAVKGNKIIIEVMPRASLASNVEIQEEERESGDFTERSGQTLSSLIESPSMDLLTETPHIRDDTERYRKKIEEQEATIEGLEAKIRGFQDAAAQRLKDKAGAPERETALGMAQLKESLDQTRLEVTGRLMALEEEMMRLRTLPPHGKEEERKRPPRNDEIGQLIEEAEAEEVAKVPLITESIRQWVCRMAKARNERVAVPLRNPKTTQEECQTLPRFLAIAKLEQEKAAHFAREKTPWPKEDMLANLKTEGYGVDLSCLFLYRQESFPSELRTFAVLFAFWEMAHHNRFYRNALAMAMNSGAIPADVGIAANTSHDDAVLRLLHYADLTRILMGHYGAIAQSQFTIDLFVTQDETMARFGDTPPDISRATMEGALFI